MKRKDVLIAVIGGCIGALVTIGVGLFAPAGVVAQSQPTDAGALCTGHRSRAGRGGSV